MEIALCDNRTKSAQEVYFELEENSGYMKMILHILAVLHTLISLCCIIGYYCLKVTHPHEMSVFTSVHVTHYIYCSETKYMSLIYKIMLSDVQWVHKSETTIENAFIFSLYFALERHEPVNHVLQHDLRLSKKHLVLQWKQRHLTVCTKISILEI